MNINLIEALQLLKALGYQSVPIEGLLTVFSQPQPANNKETQELPEPPKPLREGVYHTFEIAKQKAKKGETTLYDQEAGGFINVPGK